MSYPGSLRPANLTEPEIFQALGERAVVVPGIPQVGFFEIEKLSNCTDEKLDRSAPIPDGRVEAIQDWVETTAPSTDAVTVPWLNLS